MVRSTVSASEIDSGKGDAMPKAQVIHRLGPPSATQWEDWPVPDPRPGEVRMRHTAIGVNFADTYHHGDAQHLVDRAAASGRFDDLGTWWGGVGGGRWWLLVE